MMPKRPALVTPSDTKRFLKIAREVGYPRARVIAHPDGRIEFIGETGPESVAETAASPFRNWKADHAR